MSAGNTELGDPQMHVRLANCMWTMSDKSATLHYAAGEAPEELSARLEEAFGASDQQLKRDQGLTLGSYFLGSFSMYLISNNHSKLIVMAINSYLCLCATHLLGKAKE